MVAPNSEEANTSLTGGKTHSLGSHEVGDVSDAAAKSSISNTLEEVARQLKAATDPLTN